MSVSKIQVPTIEEEDVPPAYTEIDPNIFLKYAPVQPLFRSDVIPLELQKTLMDNIRSLMRTPGIEKQTSLSVNTTLFEMTGLSPPQIDEFIRVNKELKKMR